MLGQDRFPSVQSRIDVEDSRKSRLMWIIFYCCLAPPKPNSVVEAIRQRFTFVYIVLGLVLLVALAVLVVAIMLLCNMKNMDQRYRNITGTGSERFMVKHLLVIFNYPLIFRDYMKIFPQQKVPIAIQQP